MADHFLSVLPGQSDVGSTFKNQKSPLFRFTFECNDHPPFYVNSLHISSQQAYSFFLKKNKKSLKSGSRYIQIYMNTVF